MVHQATGAFSLTWHDHFYHCGNTCLLILPRVSDNRSIYPPTVTQQLFVTALLPEITTPKTYGQSRTWMHTYESLMEHHAH